MAYQPGQSGNKRGKPKGSKAKRPEEIVVKILQSLDIAGGVKYLVRMAEQEPKAYLSLLGKVIPRQHTIDGNLNINHTNFDSRSWLEQQITSMQKPQQLQQLEPVTLDSMAQESNVIDITPLVDIISASEPLEAAETLGLQPIEPDPGDVS